MIREIILDTETTGLDPAKGDRIVELGAIELINHVPTGRTFHRYINPQCEMPAEAQAIHGLSTAFLRDKPLFAEIAEEFLAFIEDSRLVIHNAAFDIGFLNAELTLVARAGLSQARVVDTLHIARQKFPGASNSLDALCRRFSIDTTRRAKHGALLDSELLAQVYLELLGGRQAVFTLDGVIRDSTASAATNVANLRRLLPLPPRLSTEELTAHRAFVASLGSKALWIFADS
jgi:DNA polymerase-3 subunit epsilon